MIKSFNDSGWKFNPSKRDNMGGRNIAEISYSVRDENRKDKKLISKMKSKIKLNSKQV